MKNGRVIINYSICDNAPECSGIAICPTGALYFDEETGRIAFNEELCCDCGACADADGDGCPIGAIMHAESDEEYARIKAEVEAENRKAEDLNVERYGASPMSSPISLDGLEKFISENSNTKVLIELFCDDSIHCLLHSIPISGLQNDVGGFVHKKVHIDDISELSTCSMIHDFTSCVANPTLDLPILVAFSNGTPIGRVPGAYYEDKDREQLVKELKALFAQ